MDKYHKVTKRIAEALSVVLFALVLVFQVANILFRYTKIADPMMWVEEFTRYAFIWMVFLVWHLADRDDSHFRADLVSGLLAAPGRRWLRMSQHGVALVFAVLTVWSSVRYIPATLSYSTNSFAWLPMGVIYLVIPLGLSLVAVEQVLKVWRLLYHKSEGEPR